MFWILLIYLCLLLIILININDKNYKIFIFIRNILIIRYYSIKFYNLLNCSEDTINRKVKLINKYFELK